MLELTLGRGKRLELSYEDRSSWLFLDSGVARLRKSALIGEKFRGGKALFVTL